jgi:cytoskeletal protein CcmA (bactofilin family)
MFNSEKPPEAVNTFVSEGTRFQGTIEVRGNLHIEGQVEGSIESTGTVTIGEPAVVIADVRAREATVAGRLRGRVVGRERVALLPGCRLEGDVHATSFKIEDGAYFHGNCVMGEDEPQGGEPPPRLRG